DSLGRLIRQRRGWLGLGEVRSCRDRPILVAVEKDNALATTIRVRVAPGLVALRLVEGPDIEFGDTEHSAPNITPLFADYVRDTTIALHGLSRECKPVIGKHRSSDEARGPATLLHLHPVHVGAVCEIEHGITAAPRAASHR